MSGEFGESERAAARAILATVAAAADEVGRLDGAAGDGDLGVTVATGCAALLASLEELEAEGEIAITAALRRFGMVLAEAVPSTSGTLYATGLLAAAREPVDDESASATSEGAVRVRAALAAIEKRGRATVGQKTMLDALVPAVEALEAAQGGASPSLAAALQEAADAAAAGAEATRDLVPSIGRASWLPERSRGNVDAGAHLVAVVLAAWAGALGANEDAAG